MLDESRPSFYENIHLNYVKGAKIDMVSSWAQGKIFIGIDLAQESIDSSNLKKHDRQ